ncbi:hypothetical protein EPR50_G00092600 [Perca flavescens]|uniref:YqaJ viral recombinase domain-containing protein n=1 Tax=Perca flavescens TaxID=8167 RepID=A0A484D3Q1_PERFV|nr:hypothetical protein EPR50_G00092600 [Perca flavescens]
MLNYKSTEAYQYLHSGKVGKVLINNSIIDDLVFMKADVQPSQSKSDVHSAWILTTSRDRGSPAVTPRRSYGRFHGNTATRYGQENEEVAYAWMESCGFVVEKRGTVVSVTEPWLSTSPDGVVNSTELLEIKCPVLAKNCSSLAEVFYSKLTDVKMVDGVTQLQPNGSRGYYLQVQLDCVKQVQAYRPQVLGPGRRHFTSRLTYDNNRKTDLTLLVMAQQATAGRRCLRAFVSGFFVAVPVTVTVLDRLAYVARVEGASMQPFLNPEGRLDCDVVLLNRWSVRNYEVQRGDIVSLM